MDALCRCVERYFQEQVPGERGIEAQVTCAERQPYDEDARKAKSKLAFSFPDGRAADAWLVVDKAADVGNVYDVRAALEGGEEETFSLSVADPSKPTDEMQPYASGICDYLLAEVVRAAGEQTLQEASRGEGGAAPSV